MGFVKDVSPNCIEYKYPISPIGEVFSIMLYECEYEDPPLPEFRYHLDKKGDIIYSSEHQLMDKYSDGAVNEVSGISIREVAHLKFLIENSRVWRRIQLCIHAGPHAVHAH